MRIELEAGQWHRLTTPLTNSPLDICKAISMLISNSMAFSWLLLLLLLGPPLVLNNNLAFTFCFDNISVAKATAVPPTTLTVNEMWCWAYRFGICATLSDVGRWFASKCFCFKTTTTITTTQLCLALAYDLCPVYVFVMIICWLLASASSIASLLTLTRKLTVNNIIDASTPPALECCLTMGSTSLIF